MAGYLLIALGLINLRYQTGMSGVVGNSLIVIIPGALLLLSTWLPGLAKVLDTKATKTVTIILGLILIAFAILN